MVVSIVMEQSLVSIAECCLMATVSFVHKSLCLSRGVDAGYLTELMGQLAMESASFLHLGSGIGV